MQIAIPTALTFIRSKHGLSQEKLARTLGVSFVSINRWERGASKPSPAQSAKILQLYASAVSGGELTSLGQMTTFASHGARRLRSLPLLDPKIEVSLAEEPLPPLLDRLTHGNFYGHPELLTEILLRHREPADSTNRPPSEGMSAGKNTYTYDAHTYHTKVPPQGIAELLKHYLPSGGLVLDIFAGSGMTGVASVSNGYDCILNELSPAACFIANRFVANVDPLLFEAAVERILEENDTLRKMLYTTSCRECGRDTEVLYTVWSYKVLCSKCDYEFLLWDVCRSYGATVKEHKILSEIDCPHCHTRLNKSRLKRTISVPVLVGYKCCRSVQCEAALNQNDLEKILSLETAAPLASSFIPDFPLPNGVNLRQPAKHGLDRIDRFYTPRNLTAMSHLWKTIHRVENPEIAAQLGFVFTSLYQRVTRLSEFRFWGGSGNTARFNVPFISNEANVFVTFARKARSIQDHLETTAGCFTGKCSVIQNSATSLDYLPDNSVDIIFTDPPFGSYINYSEMNILWETWLNRFTETKDEAIINRVQGKGTKEYSALMLKSLREAYRVLRPGRWMLLVFMNNSSEIWRVLNKAIADAGFRIVKADIFDKQHGTFKQFVSENTPGCDLVLHCLKPDVEVSVTVPPFQAKMQLDAYLKEMGADRLTTEFLHVNREAELDVRRLYSEWVARCVTTHHPIMDFTEFKRAVEEWAGN
jgi:DNA modification methylase/DNA-binding XRE family transcriptional regulator